MKLDLVLENTRNQYNLGLLEESDGLDEKTVLQGKILINESIMQVRKMLVEEGTIGAVQSMLEESWADAIKQGYGQATKAVQGVSKPGVAASMGQKAGYVASEAAAPVQAQAQQTAQAVKQAPAQAAQAVSNSATQAGQQASAGMGMAKRSFNASAGHANIFARAKQAAQAGVQAARPRPVAQPQAQIAR